MVWVSASPVSDTNVRGKSVLTFAGGYHEYFGDDVDLEAVNYLMLVGLSLSIPFPR
jgi:hypothetical protein